MKNPWVWALVFWGIIGQSLASPVYDYVRLEQGLSDRKVNALVQDQAGLIWMGTDNGLNCYDGLRMVTYSTASTRLPLCHNKINTLLLGPTGSLWVGTEEGLDELNPRTGQIRHLKELTKDPTIWNVKTLVCLPNGQIAWGNSLGQVWTVDKNGALTKLFEFPSSMGNLTSRMVSSFLLDEDGSLWVLSRYAGLAHLSPAGTLLKTYYLSVRHTDLVNLQGKITCATPEGAYMYDPQSQTFRMVMREGLVPHPFSYFTDSRGGVWTLESSGMNHRLLRHFQGQSQDYSSLFSGFVPVPSHVTCFLEDRHRVLWIGTTQGLGLVRLDPTPFQTLLHSDNAQNSRVSIRALAQTPSEEWLIGAYGRLYRYLPDNKTFIPIKFPAKVFGMYASPTAYQIACEQDTAWIASEGDGLLALPYKTWKPHFYAYFTNPKSGKSFLTSLLRLKNGRWLLGSYEGLIQQEGNRFVSADQGLGPRELVHTRINALLRLRSGLIAVASTRGLFLLDDSLRIKRAIRQEQGIGDNTVTVLSETPDGKLLFGTQNAGIYCLEAEQVRPFLPEFFAGKSAIASLVWQKNSLWVGTFRGLARVAENKVRFYYVQDGLADDEFNIGSSLLTQQGQVLLGGINGVTLITDQVDTRAGTQARLLLRGLDYGNQSLDDSALAQVSQAGVVLSPENRYLAVQVALDHYFHPERNRYAYRLEGYQDEWIPMRTGGHIQLLNLPPGSYKLHIRAAASDGQWIAQTIVIPVEAGEFFYRQVWFWTFLFVLVLGGIALYFRYKVSQFRSMLTLRTQIASDLHDQVGGLLTRISLLSQQVKRQASTPQAQSMAQSIFENSQEAVSTMSDVIWAIDSRSDQIKHLLDRMREHAQKMLTAADIACQWNLEGLDPEIRLRSDVRQNLYLIFKEAVTNIVKHSQASHVKISLNEVGNELLLAVENDGVHQEPGLSSPYTGQGQANMRMRAKRMKAQLHIETQQGHFYVTCRVPRYRD